MLHLYANALTMLFFGGPYLIMLFLLATVVLVQMYFGDLIFLDMSKVEIKLFKDAFYIKL